MTLDYIRLAAACAEWRCIHAQASDLPESREVVRARMLELSGEITRLENKTGICSRDIKILDLKLGLPEVRQAGRHPSR